MTSLSFMRRLSGVLLIVPAFLAPTGAPADDQQRRSAHEAVGIHLEAERYAEALEVAQRAVQLTEQEVGKEGPELIVPVLDLANAQHVAGEFEAADTNYRRAISLVEAESGRYDRGLIAPLKGLGELQMEQKEYDAAIDSFQRARHIWHRADGINTLRQLEVVDRLAESFLGARMLLEANRAKIRAFRISEHHFGNASLEAVPHIRELADWFLETGQYPSSITLYERAVRVLERELGEDDPRLVPVLNGLAVARGADGYRLGEAEEALVRVLEIVEQKPDATVAERIRALITLGDWYIQTDEARAAQDLYRQAWDLLAGEPEYADDMESLFGQPVNLHFPPMPAYQPIPPVPFKEINYNELRERFVDIEFRVGADGRVSDVTIVDADAPIAKMYYVRQRMYEAVYRPRLDDGEPVATDMRLRQIIPPIPSGY